MRKTKNSGKLIKIESVKINGFQRKDDKNTEKTNSTYREWKRHKESYSEKDS